MVTKNLLKNLIQDFQNTDLPLIYKRDINIPLNTQKIISIIGSRRSGKTFLLFQIISKLLEDKIEKEKIIYLNFEDERLDSLQSDELDYILQAYRELYPDILTKDTYIFFDEVQNVKLWEKFVRRVHDSFTKNVFITGSNSKILSKEIATSLRGRTLPVEVFPLSYKEICEYKQVKIDLYTSKSRALMLNVFEKYMKNGGFPEIVFNDNEFKVEILQEYMNVMIYNDLVERYEITNLRGIKFFVKQIISSNGKELSVRKIFNSFKSSGYKVGINTLFNYLEYCQNIYLCNILNKFTHSERLKEQTDKKVYVIDNGFYLANVNNGFDNMSIILEQTVYWHLYKKYKEVTYYKDNVSECDFVYCDNGKAIGAIQVCFSLNDNKTKKREINGLVRACKELKLKEGIILTYDYEGELKVGDIHIYMMPVYQYLVS